MRKALAISAAAGLVLAMTGSALACPYNSASVKQKMTVSEAETATEEAASTFDPADLPLEEEKAE